MKTNQILDRINQLTLKGEEALKHLAGDYMLYVPLDKYNGFRSACLSFLSNLLGDKHIYYVEFSRQVSSQREENIRSGLRILESLKDEVENGWLNSFKQLVTAEVFSDFLEMSKYLLEEKYKDPAAVMIGSVLEEHLRQLCNTYSVDTTIAKGTDIIPKKADTLNVDLVKAGVYNGLQQKTITAWLGIRNSAAHGKYSEYTLEQVETMYMGVADFITRVN